MERITDNPLVTIIMPNYNSERFIHESIECVINQTYSNWELLIVDDCSSDSSLSIIEKYSEQEKRIKLFKNNENMGAALSRNKAIMNSKGKYIAFLDSDDIWLPNKLEEQLYYMEENNVSFTCTNYYVIDENGNEVSKFEPSQEKFEYKDILKTNSIGCLTVMINKTVVTDISMPEKAIKREDLACWLDVLKKVNYAYKLPQCLAKYRKHTSVSSNKLKMIKYQWYVYRRIEHINLLKSLFYLFSWAAHGIVKY